MSIEGTAENLFDRLASAAALLPVSHIPAAQDVQKVLGAVIAYLEHGEKLLSASDGGDPTQQTSIDRVHQVIAGDTPINAAGGVQPSAPAGPAVATQANITALADQVRSLVESSRQREEQLLAQIGALTANQNRTTVEQTTAPVPTTEPDTGTTTTTTQGAQA